MIIADNMPMGSYECKNFAKKYDIEINTSSPNYPQSNGLAEKAVHICKNMLKKTQNEEELIDAMMAYRNTPTKYMNYSPAQLLQSRATRTNIPMHESKFEPKLCKNVQEEIELKQRKAKTYYDRQTKTRVDFELNQTVLFRNNNRWQKGNITEILKSPRSYMIESEERMYRRNSRHIKKYIEEIENKTINNNVTVEPKRTRSGKMY